MKIIVINGVNLNMLGVRDNNIYGNLTLKSINELIINTFPDIKFEFFQSNIEGEICNYLNDLYYEKIDGLIINPGAFSHYSIAIHDALEILNCKKVEVHLSDPLQREEFRHTFITKNACDYMISAKKEQSYIEAVKYILNELYDVIPKNALLEKRTN